MTNKARLRVCSDAKSVLEKGPESVRKEGVTLLKVYFRLACILHLIRT